MDPFTLIQYATEFTLPNGCKIRRVSELHKKISEDSKWVIERHGDLYNKYKEEFRYQPLPSNQTQEFKDATQMSIQQALSFARRIT